MPKVYYRDDVVVVSSLHVRIHRGADVTTYRLRHVTSVRVALDQSQNSAALTMLLLGLCLSIFIIGLPLLIIGAIQMGQRRWLLLIRTASGESRELVGCQREHLEDVCDAINRALDELA